MDWNTFLVILHIIGAVFGVGGATFAELFSIKALRDGVIDPMEVSYIRNAVSVLRTGLFILVLSGFGILLLYRLTGVDLVFFNPGFWAKMFILVIIALNAVTMQLKLIDMRITSAISLTSWYTVLVLGVWYMSNPSFWVIILWYLVAVTVVFLIFNIVRKVLGIK